MYTNSESPIFDSPRDRATREQEYHDRINAIKEKKKEACLNRKRAHEEASRDGSDMSNISDITEE
jgi:hypothetical protein